MALYNNCKIRIYSAQDLTELNSAGEISGHLEYLDPTAPSNAPTYQYFGMQGQDFRPAFRLFTDVPKNANGVRIMPTVYDIVRVTSVQNGLEYMVHDYRIEMTPRQYTYNKVLQLTLVSIPTAPVGSVFVPGGHYIIDSVIKYQTA